MVSDLGAYALFFSAFVFASVVPMQFVLVPAELATLPAARPERLALLRQTPSYTWPFYLLIEPGAFIMERKILLEIKRRVDEAELQRTRWAPPP